MLHHASEFGRHCWHLNCDWRSGLSKKLAEGSVTLEDYVYWPRQSDVMYSYNLATKMLGADGISRFGPTAGKYPNRITTHMEQLRKPGSPLYVYQGRDAMALSEANNAGAPNGRQSPLENWDLLPSASNLVAINDDDGRAMLERAKTRLAAMDFVGLTSMYSESLELMSYSLGVDIDTVCSCRVNPFKTKRHKKVPAAVMNRIAQDNILDMELYAFAQGLFLERYRAFKKDVGGDLINAPFECRTDAMYCAVKTNTTKELRRVTDDMIKSADFAAHAECSYLCERDGLDAAALEGAAGGKRGKKTADASSQDMKFLQEPGVKAPRKKAGAPSRAGPGGGGGAAGLPAGYKYAKYAKPPPPPAPGRRGAPPPSPRHQDGSV